ncbi:MAG: hypothetical protein WA642_05845 [Steroidobacteraceae bacterium]
MEDSSRSSSAKIRLPLILLAAVIQGWALYGLHQAIKEHHWPAADQAWLIALYALVVFIPVTLQLLAEYRRAAALWRLVAILAIAYFYFGWHHGASVATGGAEPFRGSDEYFSLALLLTILWLLALPFAQSRLAAGRWTIQYHSLFANAWRNKLTLAEAALFTGLFWLLLFLWQMLFHMLKMDYFRELFEEPIFIYPVTSLTFGCALYLIGSIEELTAVVLQQILNVLKWLSLLAGVILAFFTIALVFNLPGLVFTGQKAIGAVWLLWLIAVIVLLLNAAYRDGSIVQPYPKWIAQLLRAVVPLMVIVSLTALYSLLMRSRHYGLTVERVWAWVVAAAALTYSAGYSISAFARGPWLSSIARVNVVVAIALIAVICAALTPLLSPYRLAANSQFRLVVANGPEVPDDAGTTRRLSGMTPLQYLRFDSGGYGRARLEELARWQTGPHADRIRELAQEELAQKVRWGAVPASDIPAVVAKLRIFPAGRTLDQDLAQELIADLRSPAHGFAYQHFADDDAAGVFMDLNGDKIDEFVFLASRRGLVYEKRAGRWVFAADVVRQGAAGKLDLIGELTRGNAAVTTPKWNELMLGGYRFRVNE